MLCPDSCKLGLDKGVNISASVFSAYLIQIKCAMELDKLDQAYQALQMAKTIKENDPNLIMAELQLYKKDPSKHSELMETIY